MGFFEHKYFFKIRKENIILLGTTHKPLGEHSFIVYADEKNENRKIRVNTDFSESSNGIFSCCKYYDRGLCYNIEDFRKMTIEEIEQQAYGSWMDGAR